MATVLASARKHQDVGGMVCGLAFDAICRRHRRDAAGAFRGPVGLMDKASASGAGDSRFESWAGHCFRRISRTGVGLRDVDHKPPLGIEPRTFSLQD